MPLQKLGKTIAFNVTCPAEACKVRVGGSLRIPKVGSTKAKVFRLRVVTRQLAKGKKTKLSVSLNPAARIAIKRALRAGKKITVKVTISSSDAAGNAKQQTRQVRLVL